MHISRVVHQSKLKLARYTLPAFVLLTSALSASSDNVEWKSAIFGQSVGADKNSITIDGASKSVTLTAGTSDGKVGGGKVASGHDGISYYYVELDTNKNFVLTGKVQVNFFAKQNPDNQEAFGIMARDVIGKNLDATVLPSNMIMVGGYHGEIQSMYRDSVQDTTGKGAKRLGVNYFAARPTNDGNSVYTITMKKTNTGYHVQVNDNNEMIYYRPKILEVLNKSKVYVGFFAARVASITVSDIKLTTSDVATDPPGKPEPVAIFSFKDSVTSPVYSCIPKYDLTILANSGGKFKIKLNGAVDSGSIAKPGLFTKTFNLAKDTNVFDIEFIADAAPSVTAMTQHIVTHRSFGSENGTIYASPSGKETATGTESDPIDVYSAFNFLQPGQTAVLAEGTYTMYRPITVERGNGGVPGKIKTVKGSGKVVLDFKNAAVGVSIWADYWKVIGIDITKSRDCGVRIFGSHNVMENIKTYANANTGLQVSGLSLEKRNMWPTHNLILNCESYDNKDPAENNADGFAAKLTCGEGNIFRGCIAHHNCDDGWDLYSKLETGPIGAVVIENCIAYGNGSLSNGTKTKGDGNGFKLGGEGLVVKHVLRNSIAFDNDAIGITNNSGPAIIVENTTSFNNGKGNYDFGIYSKSKAEFTVANNISFRTTDGSNDKSIDTVKSPTNYFYNNKSSSNSEGKTITAKDFKSLEFEPFKRKPDGNFDATPFLSVKSKITSGAKIDDYSKITSVSAPAPAAK